MNANQIGKRLGIGVRVAGRIAQQRAQAQEHAQAAAGQSSAQSGVQSGVQSGCPPAAASSTPRIMPNAAEIREVKQKTHKFTRAAGRGMGGFLRPFGRVGGILWLEVTGFFFGLFAVFFAQDLWRARAGYASGPLHQRFLIAAVLTAVFAYLSISGFWRAKQK
jgi:hypothetical protein